MLLNCSVVEDSWLHFHFSLSCTGEGNGNPLQCSCLENPRDQGAWWAGIYGVAQSWTRLKQLSSSRRLLRVPWTAMKSNWSILKKNQLWIFIGRTMLKLQYIGHLMRRANSLEKTLILGKIEGKRRRRRQRVSPLTQWAWVWANLRDSGGQRNLACYSPWSCKELDITTQEEQ